MKWFKHNTDSGLDAKKRKLLIKYGVHGYGLYYYCVETIAGCLTTDNITFELEHDAPIIAHDLKMDTLLVEEIMQYCVKLGLFEFNTATGKIVHIGLFSMLDNTMSQHPCIKQLKESENFKLLKDSFTRIEQNRIEHIKEDAPQSDADVTRGKGKSNNNTFNNNILTQVLEKWNTKSGLIHHSHDTANRKFQKKHYDEINDYGIEATIAAIENYAEVLSSDKYYWSHRYSLWDFIARALDKFIPDAKPRENFLKKNRPGGDGIPTTTDEIRRAYAR